MIEDWTKLTIPNGKYDLRIQKKILAQLNQNEFDFIESFMKNYKLKEGIGIKNILALCLGEYKYRKGMMWGEEK